MRLITQSISTVFLGLVVGTAVAAPTDAIKNAESPEAKAMAIVEEADQRANGFGNFSVDMEMILRNASGQESTRELRTRTLEKDGGDWSMIIFDQPKDVEGTALLTHSHATTPDDQWLFLPALKRVKRIASNNKSGPFMGSEFAYEDLSSQEIEKYDGYKLVGEDTLGNLKTWKVERRPVDENSGYTRQIVWVDQKEYRPFKIEYYDRKNQLLKTLKATGWSLYLDDYWYPSKMLMTNHQTKKSTVLNWNEYEFGQDFGDRDFSQDALKRAR